MDQDLRDRCLRHLESILATYEAAVEKASAVSFDQCLDDQTALALLARAQTAIERIAGRGSAYVRWMDAVLDSNAHEPWKARMIIGIVEALKDDIEDGFLPDVAQMIRGEVFRDLLEMASYLLSEGYKDAAAVVAGGALESHLRRLCARHGVEIQVPRSGRDPRPKTAAQMNQDLRGVEAYSSYDQKSVAVWIDVRNDAAHGHYEKYEQDQVELMVEGIGDFITRNPA